MIQTKTPAVVLVIAIAAIGATATTALLTQHVLAQVRPCPVCQIETNQATGNPHTLNGDGTEPEPTGNPHQATFFPGGTCQTGDPHSKSGPTLADESFCNGAK